jgi:hypothetical protein
MTDQADFAFKVADDWMRDRAPLFETMGVNAKTRRDLMISLREKTGINNYHRTSINLWISLLSDVDHPAAKRVVREMGDVLEKING